MKQFLFSFVLLLLIISTTTNAQQWTDEQKDVWKGVEAYWEVSLSDKPLDFLNYFDDSYYGWSYDNQSPGTKA
ncbi:MAG: hypothetical protein H6Q27_1320, partial [Ignavibacteriaceae bacterium]|nr:hypothetical protein [Ignavibacteriaceae bacterium]